MRAAATPLSAGGSTVPKGAVRPALVSSLKLRCSWRPRCASQALQHPWVSPLLRGPLGRTHLLRTAAAVDAAGSFDGSSESAPPAPQKLDYLKLCVLAVMFFISCFNYTILQSLKDALVVTEIGAEALPFLGAYGVFPGSIAFFMYYGWVTKTLPERVHYYAALTPFLIFYAAFAFILFPLAPQLHPSHLMDGLKAFLPDGLVGLSGVLINWLYSLFFIVGELWGGVAISMLFWGLADEVCSLQEAKDVYPALGMVANVGLICAGAWIKFVNGSFTAGSAWASLRWLVGSILATSGALFFLKNIVDTKYLAAAHEKAEVDAAKRAARQKGKKDKDPGAMSRAFDVLKTSPKVGNLAILVIAYFVVAKLFDFAWKAQLRVFYPSNTDFQSALAGVSQLTGIATILMMATSRFLFQFLGWGGAAIIPPLAILASGGVFFASALVANYPEMLGADMAAWIIPIGAAAGIAGRVLSKASKYSIFDPAKEMVFITMDKNEKTEGKAAVDLLGSYFGKSGASIMMQVMIIVFGSLNNSMPLILAVHVVVCLAWTKSTYSLAALMKRAEDTIASTSDDVPDISTGGASAIAATAAATEVAKAPRDAADEVGSSCASASTASSWNGGAHVENAKGGEAVKNRDGVVLPDEIVLPSKAGKVPVGAISRDELDQIKAAKTKSGKVTGEVVADKTSLESTFSDDESL